MDVFKHCFENLTEEDVKVMKDYFDGYDYQGATYTFLANYIWRTTYCLCWERISDYLCLAGADCMTREPRAIIAMPLTRDGNYDSKKLRKVILEARKRFEERGVEFAIHLIPGHMVHLLEEAFPGEMEFTHDRDYDEYVYEKEKLMHLSGRALHKKKNHLNYFLKTFKYEAKPITEDMIPQIMELTDKVSEARSYGDEEIESLNAEKEAIAEILKFVDDPKVYTVAIFIKGKLEAFAIGERLSDDTAVEHFEKASDDFRGLYQAICSEFCKSLPDDIQFVNREEDMGFENLRQAKEALKPHHMAEKYSGCFLSNTIVE
jgi:Uncharacterized conserved protein